MGKIGQMPHLSTLPLCHVVTDNTHPADSTVVLVPGLARFPPRYRDLCAMLPVTDINGALLESLANGPPLTARPTVGLFLTDPFLNVLDAAKKLEDAGVGAVANYPTMQILDGPSQAALRSVGHSFEQECAMLAAFAQRGFSVVGYAASQDAVQALADLGARQIVCMGDGWSPQPDATPGPAFYRHAQFGADP